MRLMVAMTESGETINWEGEATDEADAIRQAQRTFPNAVPVSVGRSPRDEAPEDQSTGNVVLPPKVSTPEEENAGMPEGSWNPDSPNPSLTTRPNESGDIV